MLFALDVTHCDRWSVVAVTGELELATAPRLRQQVVALIGAERSHLVIDLTAVDFIDSVGLGVIVGGLKRARTHGGDLMVVGAVPRVRSLFEITRLDEIIALHPDVSTALASVGPAGESVGEAVDDG